MLKLLNDILTERDGQSYCPIRLCGLIAFFYYLGLATTELIRHCSDFSLTDMATGVSVILGVFSAGIGIKNKTDN